MNISYFNNIKANRPDGQTSILEFLNNVKQGTWENLIKPINLETNKEERQKLKSKTLPYVTISAKFENIRSKGHAYQHSGYICLDVDDSIDLTDDWEKIISDKFTFAAFKSASGKGIAVIVKIKTGLSPEKHTETFISLENYYLKNYGIILDTSCKDYTRARFVSHDPNTFINEKSERYTSSMRKKNKVVKLPVIITGSNDIEYLIEQINASRVDITTTDYKPWLEIGFAIASEYGEGGRNYYHQISQYSPLYDFDKCEKQYDRCIKSDSKGINIATVFYYAKQANLDLVSPKTKHVVAVAKQGKRGGRNEEQVLKLLEQVDGINDAKDIVSKVFNSKVDLRLTEELSLLEQIELFIKNNYNLKRNEITRYLENNGVEVDTVFTNSVWLQARRVVSDKTPFDTVDKLMGSDFVPNYNPIKEYFEAHQHINKTGLIDKLADCIETDTGLKFGDVDPNYKYLFIKKWLVGGVASVYGFHSPLLLCLTGGQNTGKTEFFRRILPEPLQIYYAESKLDAGKDDEMVMCQKLIVLDDEMGGKSKQEAKRLKELTSKEYFTLREPYGRKNVRLKRLAILCGTSNDELVLNDPTGNRRIVPLNVLSINHELYNSIDKLELWLEVYHLFKSGFDWRLTKEEVKTLNNNTGEFEQIRMEKELISKYFKHPKFAIERPGRRENIIYLTPTDIKQEVEEMSGQKISVWKIGQELKSIGFQQNIIKSNGIPKRVYAVVRVDQEERTKENEKEIKKEKEKKDSRDNYGFYRSKS